jgi:capsular exopolysaccharide synthesis family protein
MADSDMTPMTEESAPPMPDQIGVALLPDPGFLWQVFRRNLLLFTAVVATILAMTAFFLSTLTPVYGARASLLIEPTGDPVRTTAPGQKQGIINADEVDTEIRLIGSPLVAERAAELYADQNLSPDGDRFSADEIDLISRRFRGTVRVTRSGQTRIADITAMDSNPEFAATAANLIAEAYLSSQVDAKSSQTDASAAFINARLKELERNALSAQAALDNYMAERGLVSANGSTNAEQEVSTLNQQLASARAELAQNQGRFEAARAQLNRGGGGEDVGAALSSGTISGLRVQQTVASADLQILSQKYGPLHPERVQKEAELADIKNSIQQEIGRILSSLEAEVQTARSRVNSLERSRQSALSRLNDNSSAQAGLNRLQQRADAAQSIYQSFLERSQETGALRDSAMPDAVISARAEVPTAPIGPRYKIIGAAGSIFALGLGMFAILVAEYLRRGVQTKRDVERRLRLRYAGAIPTLRSTVGWRKSRQPPHEYVLDYPQSIFAESFRSIRTFLTLSPGSRPRAIAVTSALPGEGKTTTSLCLALTTASEGVNAILVDADLRRRGSSRLINYTAPKDIYDYLLHGAKLSECIYTDPISGLKVLGSNGAPSGPSNPLQEKLILKMFAELREKYEVIIVDTAPILGVAEGRLIATAADRVLIVTRWKKTSMRAVEAVTSMLINTKAKVTGLALTQVNIKKYASTGDGDVYAYIHKYQGYYHNK